MTENDRLRDTSRKFVVVLLSILLLRLPGASYEKLAVRKTLTGGQAARGTRRRAYINRVKELPTRINRVNWIVQGILIQIGIAPGKAEGIFGGPTIEAMV